MKSILFFLFTILITACSIAQPGQWSTKSKKAIKYVETGMNATRSIDPSTVLPNYREAIYWIDKAIEKDPNFIDAYFLKAEYCMASGRAMEAIEAYRKILEINPNISSTGFVYYDLAMLEFSQG